MSFAEAAKEIAAQKMTTTWNGALSHATTTSGRVDLFYHVLRNTTEDRVARLMAASYKEDALHTLKLVAYIRDIRGGKGERTVARNALKWLAIHHPDELKHNLKHYVAEYGRFDDLLALVDTPVETFALTVYADQLIQDLTALQEQKPVSLCAKWVPSEKKAADKKSRVNAKLAKAMGMTPADLRKTYLSPLRANMKLLEQFMCANDWESIDLNKVPSVAMHIHGKPKHAFERHISDKFAEWKESLKTGKTKVNASVLHPHQVVEQYYGMYDEMKTQVDELVEAQWQVMLENGRKLGSLTKTLVMSDVSGSMSGLPMMVSIALGILISELVEDEFKGLVMTFEETPRFHNVVGANLLEKVQCLAAAPWGGSTDFMAALRLILKTAQEKNVAQDKMPEKFIVVSDMQFNSADRNYETNFQVLQREFTAAGYQVPHLIFWNVNGATTDAPTMAKESNVSLLSGFSPAVLKAALTGESVTPFQTMMNAILDARYDLIKLPFSGEDDDDIEMV
ncbi:unnamed protein product [Aphanomyces euteiches]|uniref:TROVE domain-containing protein n=1 Tax=Aphanomyces euteiches TaxID=100861 RepID=A0A6G0WR63_9STRA|nr:hypothetical protein Ae201684_012546 [Aphanomyces euteiches]KAH9090637.1 hypothetical protein Ae201684P_014432 [Aphanomyces euteiches]